MARRVNTEPQIKFDYIVSFYLGQRQNCLTNAQLRCDKFFFMRKHLNFLETCKKNNINNAVFVVNTDSTKEEQQTISFLDRYLKTGLISKIRFKLEFRPNLGYSYGAWNEYISEHVNDESPTEYYFCIEDDYLPTDEDFIYPFIERCNEQTPYVCCLLWPDDPPHPIVDRHAASCHGLFLRKACQKIYELTGTVFSVMVLLDSNGEIDAGKAGDYATGCFNQVNFYQPFIENGYDLTSIADSYRIEFLDHQHLRCHGATDKSTLIKVINVAKQL